MDIVGILAVILVVGGIILWTRYIRPGAPAVPRTEQDLPLLRSVPLMVESFRSGARQIRERLSDTWKMTLVVASGEFFEKERTEKFKLVAEQLGLPFYPQGDGSLIASLSSAPGQLGGSELGLRSSGAAPGFPLFSQGEFKEFRNMFHGVTEHVDVAIFGYEYTVYPGGQHAHTFRQNVIYFRSPALNLPEFALRPENLFDKIWEVAGDVFGRNALSQFFFAPQLRKEERGQDIDFESHPKFSKSYSLRGSDEQKVRETFTDEVLSFFENQTGISTEGGGDQLIFYRAGRRIDPDQVSSFKQEGFRVFELFKQKR